MVRQGSVVKLYSLPNSNGYKKASKGSVCARTWEENPSSPSWQRLWPSRKMADKRSLGETERLPIDKCRRECRRGYSKPPPPLQLKSLPSVCAEDLLVTMSLKKFVPKEVDRASLW
ncbi:hypothetical protein Nepgr_009858 [Nepenthes gracilis]|uniref:Uncharacterized protein n=1 Tax=Nepenthes gracilis TaxID=150966 RepID=A0AAD3SBA7_NEPGR|nr:hypothetical protein Nepgr_009858 [Nepenthes gracilis]